jgi:hypothetical protein
MCSFLRYYAAYSGNSLSKGCPETSVRNYHYNLRNILEKRRSHLLRGGSHKSRNTPLPHSCNMLSPSIYSSLSRPNKMRWGEQVVDISIKLQKLYIFCNGAISLPYVTQNTTLSKAGYSLQICYHTGVQNAIVNVSNTPPPHYFVRAPCCYRRQEIRK